MRTNYIWSILENDFGFLARKDRSFAGGASEEPSIRGALVIQFLPFILVCHGCWVYHVKAFAILNFCA